MYPAWMAQPTTQLELFIEQAEYIDTAQFNRWTIQHPDESVILQKLSQAGAKLITGPRGSGKTTLLLKAFHSILEQPDQRTLPIYVNFKASLKLEPFYKSSANAAFLFQQWLLYKVYAGLFEALDNLASPSSLPGLSVSRSRSIELIGHLELGRSALFDNNENTVLPSTLDADIETILRHLNYKRCVLFLDDAAHAFSVEQQRDFFDFFRSIKSKNIAPKAAIYPGVTIYSPTFHVGHDAEEIDVWLRPDSAQYLPFMKNLLENRLSEEVWAQLLRQKDLLELVCFAAFGVPRALLNMIRDLYGASDEEESAVAVSFTRKSVLRTIKRSYENTVGVFSSLRGKLPMYSKFVETGRRVFDRILAAVKAYNAPKDISSQSVTIAIKKPIPLELTKVFGFFQYAGLLLPRGEISRGEKGVFEQYIVHYGALIDGNALLVKKSVNVAHFVEAFKKRHAKEFTRTTARVILDTDDAGSLLTLSLPPCQVCRTARVAESAKFCLNCGASLIAISTFESLVDNDISELPLTEKRVARIKSDSKIRKIKDILLDHEHRQLRSVDRIGPYWAQRIYSYAEEYIA
jgi:ABC-type iron transport system FetAB ATPase subunit